MNKDCASIRKLLPKYLSGHVFSHQRARVRRHLGACPLCRSEFLSLERIDDTKRMLEDVNGSDGFRLKGIMRRASGRMSVLLYRPLWLFVIAGCAVLLSFNLFVPHRDIEIENIEKALPPPSAPVPSPIPSAPAPAAPSAPESRQQAEQSLPPAPADPLVVTISLPGDQTAGQVNEVLFEYSQFKRKGFSTSVHAISGALRENEILELFRRIEEIGKVSYSRKQFSSYPPAQPIPFVMKLKQAPRPVQRVSSPSVSSEATGTPSVPASEPSQAAP